MSYRAHEANMPGGAQDISRAPAKALPMLKEFRSFVLRGNVVDLAVAVVIGAAFGTVVSELIASFITPAAA